MTVEDLEVAEEMERGEGEGMAEAGRWDCGGIDGRSQMLPTQSTARTIATAEWMEERAMMVT